LKFGYYCPSIIQIKCCINEIVYIPCHPLNQEAPLQLYI
jgi:hypothetical protein